MIDDPEITDPRDPMRRRDIVAELDRWLDRNPMNDRVLTLAALVQRARDEIVALRRYKHENHEASEVIRRAAELVRTQKEGAFSDAKREVRNEALEEAARVCDDMARSNAVFTWPAAAIRALKDKEQ